MTQEEITNRFRENYKRILLSKKQTARELNISQGSLDKLRRDGAIQSKKILGQIMFEIGEVARFIAEA